MGVSINNPITFINQTTEKPSTTGTHLALIRSHTTTLQHRRTKKPLLNSQKTGVVRDSQEHWQAGRRIDDQIKGRNHRTWPSHEARGHPCLTHSVQQRPSGPCRTCLSQKLGKPASSDLLLEESQLCIQCSSDIAIKAAILGLSSRVASDSLRNDPFHTLPVPANNYVNNLLDYYKQTFSPQYDWIYVATGEKDPHICLFLPMAIQVPYYFHTVLLLCRVFHVMSTGGDPRSDGMVMYHRGKAFQGLQSSLGNVENVALPLSVVAFISIDWMLGNKAAVAAHLAGLTRILTARIGLPPTRITPLLEALILTIPATPNDTDSSGDSSVLRYPQHPFPSELCQNLSELPIGFGDLCLSGSISTASMMLMGGMKTKLALGDMQDAKWLSLFTWGADDYRGAAMTPIDEMLLQGLLAFCFQHGLKPAKGHHSLSLEALQKRIASRGDVDLEALATDQSVRDALVWIHLCVVGALDSQGTNAGSVQQHSLLLDRVFNLFKNRRELEWHNVSRILDRFWFPLRLQEQWKACWVRQLETWRTQPRTEKRNPTGIAITAL